MATYFVQTDEDGRITATTNQLEYAGTEMFGFTFPEDFDFGRQDDYRIINGELVHDPLPTPEYEIEAQRQAKRREQMQTATLLFLRSAAPTMTDAQAMSVSELFESWDDILAAGGTCESDTIIRHDGELYRVAQTHPAQAQYEPGAAGTESLYTHITMTPEGVEVWQQPTGAHDAYSKGDRVLYPDESGSVYESLIDGNTWSPDAYPAGWQKVTG